MAAKKTAPRKRGRPSIYTQKLADAICKRIANGESLNSIGKRADMPARWTILKWERDNADFGAKFARAREDQAEFYAAQIIEIADESSSDMVEGEDGEMHANPEAVQRSKLRVDARKWYASKVAPKRWGDKVQLGGADDLPPIRQQVDVAMTPAEAYKLTLDG